MHEEDEFDVTDLLSRWRGGDTDALEQLTPRVYSELKRIADHHMRHERPEHTLQATALVNETFIKLMGNRRIEWRDRLHFFSMASRLMRRVLVDHARRKSTLRRGGVRHRVSIEEVEESEPSSELDVLDLHEALEELAEFDPTKSQMIEMRYFGGLTLEEIGAFFELTIKQTWQECQIAQAWLHRRIATGGSRGS